MVISVGVRRWTAMKGVNDGPGLSLAQLARLAERPDGAIDLSDQPEITDWSGAVHGDLYRPRKHPVTIRLDADVLAWFQSRARAEGGHYQTALNRVLREYMLAQRGR